jgi:hypothetical protein
VEISEILAAAARHAQLESTLIGAIFMESAATSSAIHNGSTVPAGGRKARPAIPWGPDGGRPQMRTKIQSDNPA